MEDRIPSPGQQGRILITPEDGSASYYATVTMADNPTNPGTPLNKDTLLQDQTEVALFGTANNRTVDEAFRGIANKLDLIMGDQAALTLTVQDSAGNGIPGVLIGSMFDENGDAVYTNASGVASGYVAEGNQTLSVSGYADIQDASLSLDVVKGNTYTETLTVTTRDFFQATTTRNIRFSENVQSIDVNAVGGGGGAGDGYNSTRSIASSGGGGGGGYCVVQNSVSFTPNTIYQLIVGAGGQGGGEETTASDGGTSSFLGVVANGGKAGTRGTSDDPGTGGSGNGKGGNGVYVLYAGTKDGNDGVDGSVQGFSSFTKTVTYGGGGGSGGAVVGSGTPSGGSGGYAYGGDGGIGNITGGAEGASGYSGRSFGGGGGSGGVAVDGDGYGLTGNGGSGYQGCINIRMHLKSAS